MKNIGLIVLFLSSFNVWSAPPSSLPNALDLSKTVQQGVEFSPEVKRAKAELDAAISTTDQRQGLLFPKVDLYGSARLKKDPSRFVTSSSANDEEYDSSVRLVQPLYRGGLLTNGISSYKTNEEIFKYNLFNAQQVTVASLVNAYYDLAQSQEELAAVEEQVKVLKSYSSIVSKYEQNGRSRRMDRLQANVNLSLAMAEQVRLTRARQTASDVLRRLLGMPPGTDAELLSATVREPVKAAEPITFDKAFATAEKNNPELRAVELEREKTRFDNSMELAEDLPMLNLEGSYGYRAGERPNWFEEPSNYYTIGLVLTVPIFSGLTSVYKRRVHTERIKQDDRSVEIKRLDLRERIQRAILALSSEFERLSTAQTAVKLGREALQLANTAFGRGVASTQDVLNAQSTHYSTEKLLIESQYSYLKALLALRQLTGADLQKTYTSVN